MATEFTYNAAITVQQTTSEDTFAGSLPSASQARIAAGAGLADQTTPFDVADDTEYAAFLVAITAERGYMKKSKK